MRLSRVATLVACSLLASCAHYNPYFNTAKVSAGDEATDDGKPKKAYALSQAVQIELVDKSNALANEENNTTLALAGALGLGAYKLATGGGHQVVALTAGAGALYGVNQALYDQRLSAMLHETVSALLCLDGAYNNVDPDKGTRIAAKIKAINAQLWASDFEASYQNALKNIAPWTEQYTTNVKLVVSTLNQRIANGQLGPEDRYKLIVSSLNTSGSKASQFDKTAVIDKIKRLPLATDNLAFATVSSIKPFSDNDNSDKERQNQALYELANDFSLWLINSNALLNDPAEKVALCRTNVIALSIPELVPGQILQVTKDQPIRLKIVNSSGNIVATTSPGAPVTARIVIEQKDLFLEIQKVANAKGDGVVYVTDYGKDESLVTVKVHAVE